MATLIPTIISALASSSGSTVLSVNGNSGTLLNIVDDLTGSLFSVNSISGLPILEVFPNNSIYAGQFNKGDLVIVGNNVGIGISTPSSKLEISSSTALTLLNIKGAGGNGLLFVSGSGNVGINSITPTVRLDVSGSTAINVGTAGGSGNFSLNVNKNATAQLQVRGDGYVGIGAAPSTNGWVQVTSINTSTAHFSLTNGITNANASNTYTFRGWWSVYFNSPVFNGATSGLYYIPIYS